MTVNRRHIRRSSLEKAIAAHPKRDPKAALKRLTERLVLLQEADASGLGSGLPTEPADRATAFLSRVISKRVICGNINDRELGQMYAAMKTRFVHGDLYRVADLQWRCPGAGEPENAACAHRAARFADHRWRPILSDLVGPEDLYWLGSLHPQEPLRYVEYTFHVDRRGRASVPSHIAAAVTVLEPGQATITSDAGGARIHLLLEHRPPIDRQLSDPSVRAEVLAELCPRTLKANRARYLERLIASAWIKLYPEHLPPGLSPPK